MDRIKIQEIRASTFEEWDIIWKQCDYATYFHSREWAELWQVYTANKMKPCPKLVIFSDGTKALLPLSMQRRKSVLPHFFSSPGGTFGGWISECDLKKEHCALLIDFLINKIGNLIWRLNPYNSVVFNDNCGDVYKIVEDETLAVDLTHGFEDVLCSCSRGHRCSAKKASKEGIRVRTAENEEEWKDYYAVYEDSLRRWGEAALTRFGWELFYAMFRRNSPHIKLWVATYNGVIVAGALCFYAKRHVVCWHAATLEKYFVLRPTVFLMLEAIKDACEKGYWWFDFNPSEKLEGVITFKKRFGAKPLPCPDIYQKTNSVRGYIFVKEKIKKLIGVNC